MYYSDSLRTYAHLALLVGVSLGLLVGCESPAGTTPALTLTASPTSIAQGGQSNLSWNSTNADSCVASGAWSGARAVSGSETRGPLTTTSNFSLTCAGAGGSATETVTVTVQGSPPPPPTPTVSLNATPQTINANQSSTLAWSSTDAANCTASGGWSGPKATTGSQASGALASTTTFTLTCTGAGGSASASTTVTVNPLPTVSLSANPATIASGNSTTLTWSSTNATSCTASGGWSGAKAVNGSQPSGALVKTTIFTLNCTGPGGTATASTTVTVNQAPGGLSFQRLVIDTSSPNDPWMKEIADLNGDGLPDLIIAGALGPVVWYQAPNWTKRTISQNADSESGSAVADIDGDGDIDVVVGKTWWENVNGGTSWIAHPLPDHAVGTHNIVIADVNGDGKPDIIMRGETQTVVTVFLQVSKTSWTAFDVQPGISLNGLDVADVNGDGRPDIVVGGVWMENPGGNVATATWPKRTFTTGWNSFAAVKVIDIDGDGRADIVLSVSESVGKLSWFKGPADPRTGPWVENIIATNLAKVHSIAVVDLDRNGTLDVIASEFEGQGRMIVYLGNGGSTWQAITLGTDSLHNLTVADVDADGDLDLYGAAVFGVNPVILYRNISGTTTGAAAPSER